MRYEQQTGKSGGRRRHFLVAAALWACVAAEAGAADVKLIANPSVKVSTISADEIKGVFLETRTALSDGSRVQPVLLKSGRVHESFVRQFIGRSEAALEVYYRSLVFTGRGLLPPELASDAEMAAYVARTKGAIGYVSAEANVAGVKTLDVK